jgi:glycerol-3-phosphate acyltransferase PlsY
MDALVAAAVVVAAYALGSISFALLFVRWKKGVDLRTVGSGNLGATNASRVLGRGYGIAIYALDFLKGFAPAALVAGPLGDPAPFGASGPALAPLAGLAAFLGHCYPAWHGFRGGKGVATASGLVLALSPVAGLAALATFGVLVLLFRMISVGSTAAAAILPFAHLAAAGRAAALAGRGAYVTGLFALVALWVIVRHRSNLARVVAGTEAKVGGRRAAATPGASDASAENHA